MDGVHIRARLALHPVERARIPVDTPVARTGDEERRLPDPLAGEDPKVPSPRVPGAENSCARKTGRSAAFDPSWPARASGRDRDSKIPARGEKIP